MQLREKKLTEKEEIIEEGLSKLKAIKPNQATYKFDFSSVASPAFNIINDSKRTFTGGVSNLKYEDLREILDIIIQLRDHGQEAASMVEQTYRKNKTLIDGGLDTFNLKIHDAKLEQDLNIKIRRELGLIQ